MPFSYRAKRYHERRSSAARSRAVALRSRATPYTRSFSAFSSWNVKGTELKAISIPLQGTFGSVLSAWTEYDILSVIGQGDDMNNRTGRRIMVKGVAIKGTLVGGQSNTIADDQYDFIRIVISRAKGATGALPPFTTYPGVGISTQIVPGLPAAIQTIYMDRTYSLSSPGRDSVGYMPATRTVSFSKALNWPCTFTGTGANSNQEHLCLSMISDSAAVPSPGFTSLSMTLYWTD